MATPTFLYRLLDLVSPRACAVCGKRLAVQERLLCTACNRRLPRCHYAEAPYDNEMAKRFWHVVAVEKAASWLFHEYGNPADFPLYALKYWSHPEYADDIGRLIAQEFLPTGFFDGIDCIVPVPLAPVRERERGYNQSLLLAWGIGRETRLPVVDKAVRRTVYRGSQTRLDSDQRDENVRDAFRLADPRPIHDRHVLVVDDVCTSGATLIACARELMKAGGVRLSFLTMGYAGTR